MPAAMGVSNAVAIAMCDAAVDQIDVGAGTAKLRIYEGVRAASVDTAISSQVLLAELDVPNPAFGAAADANPGGRAVANAISPDTVADNTGTATWFRVINRNGDAVIDGNCGTSGADLILDDVNIVAGQTVQVNSWTVTQPES